MYKHILLTFIFLLFAGFLVAQDANWQQKYEDQMENSLVETLRRTDVPENVRKIQIKELSKIVRRFSEERQKQFLLKLPKEIRKQIETELIVAKNEELIQMKKKIEDNPEVAFRLATMYLPPEFLKPTAQKLQKDAGLKFDPAEAYKYFKLADDKGRDLGHYDGLFGLGICYAEGFGVKKDIEKSKEFFKTASKNVLSEVNFFLAYDSNKTPEQREAAKQKAAAELKIKPLKDKAGAGDTEAEREYGIYLIDAKKNDVWDEGGKSDAAKYLYRAAKKGDKEAQFQLGKLCVKYNWGMVAIIREVSRELAIQYLTNSPEKLDAELLYDVGKLFEVGRGGKKDYAEMIKWFTQSADKGFLDAQFEIATRYRFGIGHFPQDEKKSSEYYQKCAAGADENSPNIQLCKGVCFQYGYGRDKNAAEAEKWLRKSAEQGFARGQTALGIFLEETAEGGIKKRQEAFEWYKKAAEQNDVYAMMKTGNFYHRGVGAPPDDKLALKWYIKAAETNEPEAQYQLGVWFDDGKLFNKGSEFQWYKKAAEQGHVLAQVHLGLCFLLGKGTRKNKSEAEKWLKQAAEQGNETAAEALKALDKF
ncbi:MAG: sel1 repeat family protein [Planctomycetaceae bacterium]|jgi:TPR repeat protein|nr:sel1 repeat family protein [Planctomycetaceae bacterium]